MGRPGRAGIRSVVSRPLSTLWTAHTHAGVTGKGCGGCIKALNKASTLRVEGGIKMTFWRLVPQGRGLLPGARCQDAHKVGVCDRSAVNRTHRWDVSYRRGHEECLRGRSCNQRTRAVGDGGRGGCHGQTWQPSHLAKGYPLDQGHIFVYYLAILVDVG